MNRPLRGRILLVLVYLVVPALLAGAEVVLRAVRPDLRQPLVREIRADGSVWWEVNRSALDRYFDPGSPLVPEFKPALVRRTKDGTFRVVCLGSSTMFGTPYQMTANIPALVRRQLRGLYPDRAIEVVNLGASAINSNVVADLLPDIAGLEPDLVLLYMGHNEFYGPDGVSAGSLERAVPALITLKYRLRDLAIYRVLFPRGAPPSDRNLMREVSQGGMVSLSSPDAEYVIRRFEDNLERILEFWKDRGVPVVVSDLASNLMFPPFLADTAAISTPALRRLSSTRNPEGIDAGSLRSDLERLLAHDSTNAFGLYWRGRRALAAGDTVGARGDLLRARDHDLLKFRAPAAINDVLRRVGRAHGTSVVSTDSLFTVLSGGIPGDSLFWEHLHPTLTGYYHIAALFTREIQRRGYPGTPAVRDSLLPLDPESLAVCWLDRAYGDLSIAHLTGRWPFTGYRREPEVLTGSAAGELRAIAQAVYDRKIPWDRGCYESAAWFWRNGDLAAAQTTYEALLEEYPSGFYPLYLLGNLLSKRGERERAVRCFLGSIASNPSYPNARLDLGLLLVNEGRFSEAIVQLEAGITLPGAARSPQLLSAFHYGIGAAKANAGDYAGAIASLDESLRLSPRNADAARLRASVAATARR